MGGYHTLVSVPSQGLALGSSASLSPVPFPPMSAALTSVDSEEICTSLGVQFSGGELTEVPVFSGLNPCPWPH